MSDSLLIKPVASRFDISLRQLLFDAVEKLNLRS